jgi:hypothetical protein
MWWICTDRPEARQTQQVLSASNSNSVATWEGTPVRFFGIGTSPTGPAHDTDTAEDAGIREEVLGEGALGDRHTGIPTSVCTPRRPSGGAAASRRGSSDGSRHSEWHVPAPLWLLPTKHPPESPQHFWQVHLRALHFELLYVNQTTQNWFPILILPTRLKGRLTWDMRQGNTRL